MLTGWKTERLSGWRRQYQNKLDYKLAVAARHQAGTAYHTRAMLEAETFRLRIAEIDAELEKRNHEIRA